MSAPVRHTCPNIDKVIKRIVGARQSLKDALEYDNEEDKNFAIKCADDDIYGLDDELEDLRSDNDALRNWGHDLEKRIEELEDDIYQLSQQKY